MATSKTGAAIGHISESAMTQRNAMNQEAARAGEHGKGFAVVADEVGKLALKSANSSKEIAQLVEQAVRDAHLAVKHVSAVSQDLNRRPRRRAAHRGNDEADRVGDGTADPRHDRDQCHGRRPKRACGRQWRRVRRNHFDDDRSGKNPEPYAARSGPVYGIARSYDPGKQRLVAVLRTH